MGILNKIKDALFEEQEIEVPDEEVEKKQEKPIVKRVVFPKKEDKDKTEEKVEEEVKEEVNEPIIQEEVKQETRVNNFKMLDDSDFRIEDTLELLSKNNYQEKEEESIETLDVIEDKKDDVIRPSDIKEELKVNSSINSNVEYGSYGVSNTRRVFKPSPIISPIYGIVDENSQKENVKQNKEIRRTYSYEKKASIDDVRKKAYGQVQDKPKENTVVDLSEEKKAPVVDKVTVGDAQEYYEDLGLEYNVDYVDNEYEQDKKKKSYEDDIDSSKLNSEEFQKQVQKELERQRDNEEIYEDNEEEHEEPIITKVEEKEELIEDSQDDKEDTDNLFDLIDSMYDKES